jgi:hypothetical protein
MESLALLVVIILLITLFSGPIALFLTWLPVINRDSTSNLVAIIRRVFVTVLAVIGSLMSFNLFIANFGFAAILMAVIGSLTAFFAVKREYFPNGFGNKFSGGSDRRNGPSGQH